MSGHEDISEDEPMGLACSISCCSEDRDEPVDDKPVKKKKKAWAFRHARMCECVHARSHQCPKNDDVRGGQGGRGGVAAKNKLPKVLSHDIK